MKRSERMRIPILISIAVIVALIIFSRYRIKEIGIKSNVSLSLSSDRKVYHSSELVKLTAFIYSDSRMENVTVRVNGINGRLNQRKTLDLKPGMNEVTFTYRLPRCNVCGGIRPGNYELSCEVIYQNLTVKNSTTINVQQ